MQFNFDLKSVAMAVAFGAAGGLLVGMIILVWNLVSRRGGRRSKWGINLNRVECPECGAEQPMVRSPKNLRQALWGGNTCANCGCEMDKWGRRVSDD